MRLRRAGANWLRAPEGQSAISRSGFDPKQAFKIGPMNGREARASGLRLGEPTIALLAAGDAAVDWQRDAGDHRSAVSKQKHDRRRDLFRVAQRPRGIRFRNGSPISGRPQ
jgi:hypothetical protein